MGANIATEVAQQQQICESTLACQFDADNSIGSSNNNQNYNERTRLLFHNHHHFRVQHSIDVIGTEICGAIKNCIALGAGYVDGLQYGSNTKAALLRVGLYEIHQFATFFFPDDNIQFSTMMESCGVADLITTCYSGRNRLCAETFAKEQIPKHDNIHRYNSCRKHWEDIELRLLNGQKIQGVNTIDEVYQILKAHNVAKYFPLLTTIYNITFGYQPIQKIVDGIQIISNNSKQNVTNMTKQNNRCRL
jgi:glycerol-3-phosphate dehydrogenase (NAD+)